jgi:outer membrane protein OmpA-like peptidoglycan-associated protein
VGGHAVVMSEENSKLEEKPAVEPVAAESNETEPSPKPGIPPIIGIGFLVVAILVIGLALKSRSNRRNAATQTEVPVLQANVEALRSDINRQRMSMGLSPLPGGSEPVEDISARITKDTTTLVALAGRYQEMLSEKGTELLAKDAELLRAQKAQKSLAAEASRLQSELQRALVTGSEADFLRKELETVKAQREALAEDLRGVRKQLAETGGQSSEEFAALQRQFDEAARARDFFEQRVKQLELELAKQRLFANSENELLPAAVELFRNLRDLENRPDSDLTTAYSGFGVNLGANVLHTLNFQTGSSNLTPEEEITLSRLVEDVPEGDLVLIVGYASKTGEVDANRLLSSDRATAAAQYFSTVKKPGQLVQAVYLGQTDRFSSRIPERNQLCEIWHIRKR